MIKTLAIIRSILIIVVIASVLFAFGLEPGEATIHNVILAEPAEAEFEDFGVGSIVESEEIVKEDVTQYQEQEVKQEEVQISQKEEIVEQEEIKVEEQEVVLIEQTSYKNLNLVGGRSKQIQFEQRITLVNVSDEASRDTLVILPMLINNNSWEANYPLISLDGRIGMFDLGEIGSLEEKTLIVTYEINLQTFSLQGNSSELEVLRTIFESFPKNGNCLDLHTNLKQMLDAEGFQTRLVYGFARAEIAEIIPGSMKGNRHAWTEVYLNDLDQWIPLDLNFQYFGEFPYASHITEGYDNLSTRVDFTGGELIAYWENFVQ